MSFDHRLVDRAGLLYALHPDVKPSNEDWLAYVDSAVEIFRQADGLPVVGLTITDGGAPNPAQRKRLVEAVPRGAKIGGLVLSNSRVVRGIVTALGWFIPGVQVMAPAQAHELPEHLPIDASTLELIWQDFVRLQREVPAVETLRVVATALGKTL